MLTLRLGQRCEPRVFGAGYAHGLSFAETRPCVVLDPFNGAGTTGLVALRQDRDYIGIELNADYARLARNRIYDDGPLLNVEAA